MLKIYKEVLPSRMRDVYAFPLIVMAVPLAHAVVAFVIFSLVTLLSGV